MNWFDTLITNPWFFVILIIIGLIVIYFLWKTAFRD